MTQGRYTYSPNGTPRIWQDGRCAPAQQLRRIFKAISDEFGPLSPYATREAWRVASLSLEADSALAALLLARQQRTGPASGRRPTLKEVEQLARRAGLADRSYRRALAQLGAIARGRHPAALGDALALQADNHLRPRSRANRNVEEDLPNV